MDYTLDNPHPGFGKDPNILNEYGHTAYPKWINVGGNRVIANTPKEEEELLAGAKEEEVVKEPKKSSKTDWKS
jgi:hypothetical protein